MMRSWARRAAGLHRELVAVAEVQREPWWWLIAGGVALPWAQRTSYVISDAEPASDTFIGTATDAPADVIWDAIARAHAARETLRALDRALPDQPLAVTVRRTAHGAIAEPSALDIAAFAIGAECWCGTLGDTFGDTRDRVLADDLALALANTTPRTLRRAATATAFVAIAIGDEPIATARHGHRRAWIGNGTGTGPWLGLSRTTACGDSPALSIVTTCHMIVDGFGHAWIASEIWTRTKALMSEHRPSASEHRPSEARPSASEHRPPVSEHRPSASEHRPASEVRLSGSRTRVPPLAPVVTAMPLAIAWRELESSANAPGALPLAHALGRVLHRVVGRPDARFSPTFQIPVAPGAAGDRERRKRRVAPAIASVRFDRGQPEPFEVFAERTRELLRREADGSGLSAQLLAAAQAVPAPLAWKRRAVGPARPQWLEAMASLIGGRGCVSRLRVDLPGVVMPAACAVSSPARLPSETDPLGGCVVTVLDDGVRAAITLCGVGFVGGSQSASSLLDEVLAHVPVP